MKRKTLTKPRHPCRRGLGQSLSILTMALGAIAAAPQALAEEKPAAEAGKTPPAQSAPATTPTAPTAPAAGSEATGDKAEDKPSSPCAVKKTKKKKKSPCAVGS